ncbi:MAG: NADH-quinone oxidoreductase subunit C [Myxococcales bacterium]|nr:NADH-quinone oxidoreductase subunit C [Myxococcales bacterium]
MSKAALDRLVEHLRDGVISTHAHRGDETAVIDRSLIRSACLWLRDTEGLEFNMLSDLTAVDYYTMGREPRFEVVYHLHSLTLKQRLRVKVGVPEEDPVVDTVCDIWQVANWCEREVWDLYGIRFKDHPDMRRILMYEEFDGHPLRKDYPKDKRQPLYRRPQHEIDEALAGRPGSGHRPGFGPRNLLES